ncbi:SRR1-like protein isoform X2 [Osmerus eperlanus]
MPEKDEGWQVARRKKGANRRRKPSHPGDQTPEHSETLDLQRTKKRITETMSELRCTDFWPEWKEQLAGILLAPGSSEAGRDLAPEAPGASVSVPGCEGGVESELECVCYGLGSFSSCVSARYQLAMLLLLLDSLQIPVKSCSLYDPVFSSGEREILRELGLTVLTENEEGKRQVTRSTLFYLMHCGKALYNNLLWKNWQRETLPLLTIVGNSFSGIHERMVERELQRDYTYIAHAVSVVCEQPLPCSPRLLDVFNDTALITFPPLSLDKLPPRTWEQPPEPLYQHFPDLEIIQRQQHR